MKKEGIQTRKRKPKNHSVISGNLAGPSGLHKTEIKSSLLGESSVSKFVIQFLFRFALLCPRLAYFSLVYLRIGRIVVSLGFRPLSLSLSLSPFSMPENRSNRGRDMKRNPTKYASDTCLRCKKVCHCPSVIDVCRWDTKKGHGIEKEQRERERERTEESVAKRAKRAKRNKRA